MMRKSLVIAGIVAAMTVGPVGSSGTASACPDPDNPCTPMPWQPIPPLQWCKLDPRC